MARCWLHQKCDLYRWQEKKEGEGMPCEKKLVDEALFADGLQHGRHSSCIRCTKGAMGTHGNGRTNSEGGKHPAG